MQGLVGHEWLSFVTDAPNHLYHSILLTFHHGTFPLRLSLRPSLGLVQYYKYLKVL